MADYYPVLSRAVSKLPRNDAPARRELYAHARTILGERLRRDGRDKAVEILREQAALEAAIGRIEAEVRSPGRMNGKSAAPGASRRAAIATAEPRTENTARSLSRILQAVQSDQMADDAPPPRLAPRNVIRSPLPAIEERRPAPKADESTRPATPRLGQAPNSVGTMLFGLSYVVAALAFAGVTYIRCSIWVYQGVIGYPTMLGVMALTLALFIVPPVAIFRRRSSLPTIDSMWRFIYGRSRGLL